ncbi:RNA-guided endonuclease TnpB family protein [Geobacillus sp. C56-T2]|uniref:RNA-guided endonuclease InsQ/TnpB family protein n=1 Tax=Geobacillus sp. C56-T2 TaxID=600773 RepID=UPI00119DEDC4|nr:RNA-guided endonuclease TnpB family protein [Geobacillus sp. C56-T2]NNV04877.1 transposase [Geobacillus sp. MMMUD3]TWG30219.1 putative transposase [Geobacillus sp. C56-T2]
MIKTYKVMLLPNNKQRTKLFECAGVSRWAYNWTLATQQENYKNGGTFLNDRELRKILTQLKKQKEYAWLNHYSNNITKQAIKDACQAYKNFFEGRTKFPTFKSKKKSKPSFYQDTAKIKITKTHVKLEKLTTSKKKNKQKFNYVKLAEKGRIPTGDNIKYVNPRVTFDGVNWWFSIGVEEVENKNQNYTDGIGIDLGVKDLAVVSNGQRFRNINKSNKVKKLEKRLKRLQRKRSRKYEKNKIKTEGGEFRYRKTNNIKKLEFLVRKTYRRLKNIRHNSIHQITTSLVKTKPEYVVMESLNTLGMLKNRKLSKAIQEQTFHELKRQMEYKCAWNGIKFILADRFFPSSKTCSHCGAVKEKLSLSERTFVCDECGNHIDRDVNASRNLKKYGESIA